MTSNPVSYVNIPNPNQDDVECGYTVPGWYFCNEIWSYMYGPYESEAEANRKCAEYARTL